MPCQPPAVFVLRLGKFDLKVRSGDESAHFFVIAGEPINEPIVQYSPFVMNEQHEIYEAMLDYQAGGNAVENAARWASEIGMKRIR
ncbi:Pirin C-terminal cupin domain-containing protein [Blyttiomyces helicus]|uniref:Pirin C-terminal cupin domain-containing protein n=1 Tax=Blyttiomyces helicus TaxID=388810 RepID=A0A4P9VYG6_9FUNG|nr:Pirin C-terminal cupin domain-containing protein [Blyttiomyces helicus]|eukprot:RKO83803.1 Pirin C-terminal cupin domain-containing protein [Blyttiomyces helicus]